MQIPQEMLNTVSELYQQVRSFTLMIVTECHGPDHNVMQEKIREFLSKLEAETFQLKLFEE